MNCYTAYTDWAGRPAISGPFCLRYQEAGGIPVIIDGINEQLSAIERNGNTIKAVYGPLCFFSSTEMTPEEYGGIVVRDDTLTNTGNESVTVLRALARYCLPGGDWEVFTQHSTWEFESQGQWAPLGAKAAVWNNRIRSTDGDTPMLALYNRQTGRGIVWHVFSSAAWKITVSTENIGNTMNSVVVELGVNDRDLYLPLAPGESISLPRIICYEFSNKRDLECARLHAWFNHAYPKKTMPVIFNTWMAVFDRLDADELIRLAERAQRIGAEYFVIDAGWFGTGGRWEQNIGDWVENQTGALKGRMREISDRVHELGMKFGLWFEAERALKTLPITQEHPDYFFYNGKCCLLDFSNPDARKYITDTVISAIDRYNIDYIKSDFNDSIPYDPTGAAFLRYHQGHELFLRDLRDHREDLFIENCASGGMRLDLYPNTLFDSTWPSDNHSMYEQVRIFKDTLRRLPPSRMEKWPVLRDVGGFTSNVKEGRSFFLASDDCSWSNIRSVSEDWLRTFTLGGPLGLSFDLNNISDDAMNRIAALVTRYKETRDNWKTAVCDILYDTPDALALDFRSGLNADAEHTIVLYAFRRRQEMITLWPVPDALKTYRVLPDGLSLPGKETEINGNMLKSEGITIKMPDMLRAGSLRLIPDPLTSQLESSNGKD